MTRFALSTGRIARAADHDFWNWRDGYAGPVYGYNGYPAYGFYDARSYYSYYYGRTDFGHQDTK